MSKISKSSYFYEINTYKREDKDKLVKDIIVEIFNENKARYGYPRITLELRNRGIIINHKKVQRIMKLMGLKAINRRSNINHIGVKLVEHATTYY